MGNERILSNKQVNTMAVGAMNLNIIKWLLAILTTALATVGFEYFSEMNQGLRVAGLAGAAVIALALAATTVQGAQVLNFIKSAKLEARKVVWPTRQETLQSTAAVVIMAIVASLFIWMVDSLLLWVMSWITA